jgi:hypothetical protein
VNARGRPTVHPKHGSGFLITHLEIHMDRSGTWEPLAASYDENDNGKLDRRERRALPDSAFAFPRRRELPLVDAEWTRKAIAELNQIVGASDEERELATSNIRAAAAYYGIEVHQGAGGLPRPSQ